MEFPAFSRPEEKNVPVTGHDSLKTRRSLSVAGKNYDYFSLEAAAQAAGLGDISGLPFSLKILLENLVRLENGRTVTVDDIKAVGAWLGNKSSDREIAFRPARVLMQDLTGVPAVVDLAAMRQAMLDLGGDPNKINPLSPVDLVIDHSVQIDAFASPERSEEHTSELQSHVNLVCRLLLEKKKNKCNSHQLAQAQISTHP